MSGSVQSDSWRRWYVLLVITAVYVSNIADRYVISTLIEPIKAELALSDTAIPTCSARARSQCHALPQYSASSKSRK